MQRAPANEVADALDGSRSLLVQGRSYPGRLEKLVGYFLVMARDGIGLQLFHRVRESVVAYVVE